MPVAGGRTGCGREMERRSRSVCRRIGGGTSLGGTGSPLKIGVPGVEETVVPHDRHLMRQSFC